MNGSGAKGFLLKQLFRGQNWMGCVTRNYLKYIVPIELIILVINYCIIEYYMYCLGSYKLQQYSNIALFIHNVR